MASPVYRLLSVHLPVLDLGGRSGDRLLVDLQGWAFDPNETAVDHVGIHQGYPLTLIQALAEALPKSLNGRDAASEVARRLLALVIERGADPHVRDERGRPLEDLAPLALREFLVTLCGGDVQMERERQQLHGVLTGHMHHTRPVERVRDRYEDANGQAPQVLGAPMPIGLLAGHAKWSGASMVDDERSVQGDATVARARGGHVRQLLRWAWNGVRGSDRWAPMALAWSVADVCQGNNGTNAVADIWLETGSAIETLCTSKDNPDGFSLPLLFAGARAALDGRYGALTSDVAQVLAGGLARQPGADAARAWAEAIGVAATVPPALAPPSPFWFDLHGKHDFLCPITRAVAQRVKKGPPAKGSEEAAVWLTAWPAAVAVKVWAEALALLTDKTPQQEVESWWNLAKQWLAQHPEHAAAFVDRVAASLPAKDSWSATVRARELALEVGLSPHVGASERSKPRM